MILAHGGHVVPVLSVTEVALRAGVLAATAVVAGVALLHPRGGTAGSRRPLQLTALVASAGVLLSVPVSGTSPRLALLQVALLAATATWGALPAVPLVVLLSLEGADGGPGAFRVAALVHTAAATLWLGAVGLAVVAPAGERARLARRLTPVAVVAAASVAATGLVQARLDRVGLDGVTFDRLVLLKAALLLSAAVLGLLLARRRPAYELGVLLVAAVVGSLLTGVPTSPPPGRVLVSAAGPLAVVVVPQRPGPNLVHVASDEPVTVDGTPTTALPGATGQWARVDLRPGRSRLEVAGRSVLVDAGRRPGLVPDGPECASAQLAAALAGRTLTACPSAALAPADGAALTALQQWLRARGVRHLQVLGDGSARSRAADRLLAGPAARPDALVLTGSWESASAALARLDRGAVPADGVYLAPWLLTGPLLAAHATTAPLLALPFDPQGPAALAYRARLPVGEAPTASGYAAFTATRAPVQVWATSPASIFPKDLGHDHASAAGWFPGGSLAPVSRALA